MAQQLRTVIESEEFRTRCLELQSDIWRLQDALDAITWAVARDAEAFDEVAPGVYVIETFQPSTESDFAFVYFTIDEEDRVILQRVFPGKEVVGDPV